MDANTSGSGAPLNAYYHNITLTPSHQHLHHSLPHNLHSSSSNMSSIISLNNHDSVQILNMPTSSIYDNSDVSQQQTQIINNAQTIYNSNIDMISTNYNINQQNQQQIIIHSTPVVSASGGTIHYMIDSTSTHSAKYSSEENINSNNSISSSASMASTSLNSMPLSSTTPSASISLLNSSSNDVRQTELSEILVQDPRLSSVDHSILLHHRSNSFGNENSQYLMLNSHHLQQQQHIEQQILMNDEHDFTVISSSPSGISPVVTSANSTITNPIDSGYHHHTSLSSHHHSLGTIVYMEEEEEELMDTESLTNRHQHHRHSQIINERSDNMDDLIGGEENLLNNDDERQNSSSVNINFLHESSMIPIVNDDDSRHDLSNNDRKFLHRNSMIKMQTTNSSSNKEHNHDIVRNKNEDTGTMQCQMQLVVTNSLKDGFKSGKTANDNNHSLQCTNNEILDNDKLINK